MAIAEGDAGLSDSATGELDEQRGTRLTASNGSGMDSPPEASPDLEQTDVTTSISILGTDSGTAEADLESSAHRAARRARRVHGDRPRAPRAERSAAELDTAAEAPPAVNSVTEGVAGPADAAQAGESGQEGEEDASAADALAISLSDNSKRGARTVRRSHKKQQAASAAVEAADDNPALGALNRHLNMMMQQLNTAHRVIGRVAAERDALRQQLADLQGIPVEEIVVSTIGGVGEQPAKPSPTSDQPEPAAPQSAIAKLNYFGVDDYALMKKRRQMFALILLGVLTVIWIIAKMGYIPMPQNLSRESLTALPVIGDLMYFFLAGWILFRIVKVSSKGVRWVFPNEDQRRRRR